MNLTKRVLGIFSFLGMSFVANATALPSAELDARIEKIQAQIQTIESESKKHTMQFPWLAQWGNWPNWSNWPNWNDWRNWGNWRNW